MDVSAIKEKMILKGFTAYKIAKELDEPQSSIYNFLNGEKVYADSKAKEVIKRIDDFLNTELIDEEFDTPQDPDLFIKLYALGLDSKVFTPDEKYKLAVAYKKLTDSKIKS
jgi:predicted transcriptional regulator